MRLLSLGFLVMMAAAAAASAAGDEVLFNRVYLDATAERDVPNDEMIVILRAEHQGREPAAVAERVNQDMAWALEAAKLENAVQRETGSYSTHPIYDQRVITGWRAAQELQLTSTDIKSLTTLVGRLQERLQVGSMQFRPTRETRERVRAELIDEALTAFRRRAEAVGRHMTGREYRVVELHVNSGEQGPRPQFYAERAMMKAAADMAAPAVEGGTSVLQVTVSGNVQFY